MSEAKRMTDERLASFRRRCADGPGNPDHYAIPILEVRDLIAEIDALTAERDAFKAAYRQAADAVIAQSKRAEQCYVAGVETGVVIGEQNKRDGVTHDA